MFGRNHSWSLWEVRGGWCADIPPFAFLHEALLAPGDDATALMTNTKYITWSPMWCNDITWNFKKFLVAQMICLCAGTATTFQPLPLSLTLKPWYPKGPPLPRAFLPSLLLSCHSNVLCEFHPCWCFLAMCMEECLLSRKFPWDGYFLSIPNQGTSNKAN